MIEGIKKILNGLMFQMYTHPMSDFEKHKDKAAHEILSALFKGDEEGLLTPEAILKLLIDEYGALQMHGGLSRWESDVTKIVAKAQQALTRQDIPEAVKAERERIYKEALETGAYHETNGIDIPKMSELLSRLKRGQALQGEDK